MLLLAGTVTSCTFGKADQPQLHAKPLPSASPASPGSSAAAGLGNGDPRLARYYDQKVHWSACRNGDQCAHLQVPLDYAHPARKAITLAMLKVPATDSGQRIGSLVVNPGGPGASGMDYAASADHYFNPAVRAAFDIVGFDPRGVGASTPIHCLSQRQLDTYIASDPDPDTRAETRQGVAEMKAFGQGCVKRSGNLTAHVSTEEAARDMDVIRAVLGEERMSYFGASYGTFLGATYADLFPDRVGRMVLDGAVDPSEDAVQTSLVQAQGFQVALDSYIKNCVDGGGCYLGKTEGQALSTIHAFLQRLDAQPIPGAGVRQLTEGLAVLGIWLPLYNRNYWPILDTALSAALKGNGSGLLSLADAYTGRGPNGFTDNSVEALYAVNCLDNDQFVAPHQLHHLMPQFVRASPTFGRIFAYGLTACGSWPVQSGKGPHKLHAAGAPPILVIGTTRDPATPLTWAESLARQLRSGVLITRNGDGHTGYGAGNACVDTTVDKYLVSGVVPKSDVHC
jgi:pimeloyl-ACP methyl ester carboxylesterase